MRGNVPISPKQSSNSVVKSGFSVDTLRIRFIRFNFSLDFSPNIGGEVVFVTTNNKGIVLPDCWRMFRMHCPTTGISFPLYAVNFMLHLFTIGRFRILFSIASGIMLTCAPESILYVICELLLIRFTDQSSLVVFPIVNIFSEFVSDSFDAVFSESAIFS